MTNVLLHARVCNASSRTAASNNTARALRRFTLVSDASSWLLAIASLYEGKQAFTNASVVLQLSCCYKPNSACGGSEVREISLQTRPERARKQES
eukprot:3158-Heterococcus_DN1.PRE.2